MFFSSFPSGLSENVHVVRCQVPIQGLGPAVVFSKDVLRIGDDAAEEVLPDLAERTDAALFFFLVIWALFLGLSLDIWPLFLGLGLALFLGLSCRPAEGRREEDGGIALSKPFFSPFVIWFALLDFLNKLSIRALDPLHCDGRRRVRCDLGGWVGGKSPALPPTPTPTSTLTHLIAVRRGKVVRAAAVGRVEPAGVAVSTWRGASNVHRAFYRPSEVTELVRHFTYLDVSA